MPELKNSRLLEAILQKADALVKENGCNALSRDPDFAAAFLTEFADRIFYGCDICTVTNTHQYKLDELLTRLRSDGSISEETYYKVVRGNAAKLLGIE